jgi:predicted phosphohydrolase
MALKVRLLSDLHLEFSNFKLENTGNADVLILAGDICPIIDIDNYLSFFDRCNQLFAHVLYVPGNHEYYHNTMETAVTDLKRELSIFPNIKVLNNDSIEIDNTVFIGSTLWTNCNNGCYSTMAHIKKRLNDFRCVRTVDGMFTPQMSARLHTTALEYIHNRTMDTMGNKVVVISHHSPSFKSTPTIFMDDKWMNGAFHSDLEDFITNHNISHWFHGHTHHHKNYMVGECNVVCNPRGYQSTLYAELTNWHEELILEI